jgi:putative membrane protein
VLNFTGFANLIAQAADPIPPTTDSWSLLLAHLVAAIVFALVGVIVFFAMLLLIEKLTPFSIIKEIGEEHNSAVAIIIGAIVLGMSIIIAAAILG